MFPTTDIDGWGGRGTEGGPWASFFLRYERPLAYYAQRRLGVGAELAAELAARFVARELARERSGEEPLFRLYDPQKGRFRSLLATAFWRFGRDELNKERRRDHLALEDAPEQEADDAFCQLVAEEFFQVVRGQLEAAAESDDERAVLALKWPATPDREPLSNSEIERQTGLTRGKVRGHVERIGARFVTALRALAQQAGLTPGELQPFVGDVCRALDTPSGPGARPLGGSGGAPPGE